MRSLSVNKIKINIENEYKGDCFSFASYVTGSFFFASSCNCYMSYVSEKKRTKNITGKYVQMIQREKIRNTS